MRRHRLINFLATVSALSLALVTLLGLVAEPDSAPAQMAAFLIRLVTVVAAVAVLAGLINLINVHLGRFVRSERGWPYSVVALITALAVVVLRILDRAEIWSGDFKGEFMSARVFEAVQVSLESALAALLVFFLVYAAYRLMRREVTLWNLVFTLVVMIVLAGWIPVKRLDALADLREWIVRVPVGAGARGLLIGVGLGTIMVGVRVLVGQDRTLRG